MNPGKITTAMLDAGVAALEQAGELEHDSRATAHLVFTAMLAQASWPRAIRYRPVSPSVQYTFDGKRLPRNPFKLSDFDSEGKRLAGNLPDGRPSYQHVRNFWYLAPKYTKP